MMDSLSYVDLKFCWWSLPSLCIILRRQVAGEKMSCDSFLTFLSILMPALLSTRTVSESFRELKKFYDFVFPCTSSLTLFKKPFVFEKTESIALLALFPPSAVESRS